MGTVVSSDENRHGLPDLMQNLEDLSYDVESADIVFLLEETEIPVYAHQLILMARCKKFRNIKKEDITSIFIPGSTIIPPLTPGGPITIRLPHYKASIFKQFILYIYTGKTITDKKLMFDILKLANDFDVPSLRGLGEDYILETLNPEKACEYLESAIDFLKDEKTAEFSEDFFFKCIKYFCQNANECFKTKSFLTLPKEMVMEFVAGDYLNCDEVLIFEALLRWGKHQVGVTAPPEKWTAEERERIKEHLSGLIEHVKFMLIDNDYFASIVEPTGVVPMELILEKYRLATFQLSLCKDLNYDKKFRPRTRINYFPESTLIDEDYSWILNSWYAKPDQQWKMVFKASDHEFSAEKFHSYCDGIAPLFVIAKSTEGRVSGGFTPVPWTKPSSPKTYIPSDKAFLFSLGDRAVKFNIVKKSYALGYNPSCGPMFGAGADFLISDNCRNNYESYSNLPHSYDGPGAGKESMMEGYNFMVQEYEVFTIKWDA